MKKSSMFLLWLGASISISEIYTGGLLAPLGLWPGLAVIFVGHLIGTGLLSFGGYVSFTNRENAMSGVARALGSRGGKIVAFCNLLQLVGWTVIMIIQAASALSGVIEPLPFALAALVLSLLVLGWALLIGSPGGRLNDLAVVILFIFCLFLFWKSLASTSPATTLNHKISLALAMELSITMPVSWLPLIGDYSCWAEDKAGAVTMPFIAYFVGSVFMYSVGLLISLSSGQDIFQFIASSQFKFPACVVILLSTLTTAFLDLYSAAESSRKLVKMKRQKSPILIIGLFATLVVTFFPLERYSDFLISFLTTIGMVFIPVFGVVFLDFFKIGGGTKSRNLLTTVCGMFGYYLFNRFDLGIPTLLTLLLVAVVHLLQVRLTTRSAARLPDH